jgi:hypothetical protein
MISTSCRSDRTVMVGYGASRRPLMAMSARHCQDSLHYLMRDRLRLQEFFETWGRLALRVLRPGGHLFLASNAFLSQMVFGALVRSGLEFRGEIIRLVRTLRGGDRPKNAEQEFKDICSMPAVVMSHGDCSENPCRLG